MSTNTQPLLLDRLRELDLLPAAQLDELAALPEAKDPDARALGRVLLQRGLLTRLQITMAAVGRGKELRVGKYLLLDKLGEGGMGQVYKARDTRMGRTVALKLIRREKLTDEGSIRRFYQEVQAAAALNHPNIVQAYDADQSGAVHYLAMEFVEGADLAHQVKSTGALPVALACEYARQAALGLQHAHERGLIHRDIKPHNLLVANSGNKPVVKLLDMGLARLTSQETGLTQSGQVLGTADYLAPEQAMDSRKADVRSDIYSLGCTLYFLLTGGPPFPGETMAQVLLAHQMSQAKPLSEARPDAPPALQAVLSRMMARAPEGRYQTAAEAAEALAPFARGEAGAAPPPPPPPPPKKAPETETTNTWAGLEDGGREMVRVPRAARSSTHIEKEDREEAAPRRGRAKTDEEQKKSPVLMYSLIGLGVGLPVLALLVFGIVMALSSGKKPPEQADRDKGKPARKDGGDKGKGGEKDNKGEKDKGGGKGGDGGEPAPGAARLALSPDGNFAAFGREKVGLWGLPDGREIKALAAPPAPVFSLRFSADGKRLLGAGASLVEWALPAGGVSSRKLKAPGYLSPDGLTVFAPSRSATGWGVTAYNTSDGREVRQLNGKLPRVHDVVFSPDGDRALAISADRELLLVDARMVITKGTLSMAGAPHAVSACLTNDADVVFLGRTDGSWLELGLADGKPKRRSAPAPGLRPGPANGIAVSPAGESVLTAGEDGVVRMWARNNGAELRRYRCTVGALADVKFLPDGKHAVAAGTAGRLQVIDLGKPSEQAPFDGGKPVTPPGDLPVSKPAGSFSVTGASRFAVSRDGGRIAQVRLTGGGGLAFMESSKPDDRAGNIKVPKGIINSLDFAPASNVLFVGYYKSRTVHMIFVPGGVPVQKLEELKKEARAANVKASPDGATAVAVIHYSLRDRDLPGEVVVFDLKTGKVAHRVKDYASEHLLEYVTPKTVLFLSYAGKLQFLNVETGEVKTAGGLAQRPASRVRVTADGKHVVVPGRDLIEVAEVATGKTAGPSIRAPEGVRFGPVALCKDERYLVASFISQVREGAMTRNTGGDLRLIDRETGKAVHVFDHGPEVGKSDRIPLQAEASPDGKRLYARGSRGRIYYWGLAEAIEAVKKGPKAPDKPAPPAAGVPTLTPSGTVAARSTRLFAMSPDGKRIAEAVTTRPAQLALTELAKSPPTTSTASLPEAEAPSALAFTPDGGGLWVGYADARRVCLVGPADGKVVREFEKPGGRVVGLAPSPDGKVVLVGVQYLPGEMKGPGAVLIYDAKTGKAKRALEWKPAPNAITFLSAKKALVLGLPSPLLDVEAGTTEKTLLGGHPISPPAVAGDGGLLVVPGTHGIVTLDARTGMQQGPTIRPEAGVEFRAAVPCDGGRFLLVACWKYTKKDGATRYDDADLRLFHRETGKLALIFNYWPGVGAASRMIYRVGCGADEKYVYARTTDGPIFYWDLAHAVATSKKALMK